MKEEVLNVDPLFLFQTTSVFMQLEFLAQEFLLTD